MEDARDSLSDNFGILVDALVENAVDEEGYLDLVLVEGVNEGLRPLGWSVIVGDGNSAWDGTGVDENTGGNLGIGRLWRTGWSGDGWLGGAGGDLGSGGRKAGCDFGSGYGQAGWRGNLGSGHGQAGGWRGDLGPGYWEA